MSLHSTSHIGLGLTEGILPGLTAPGTETATTVNALDISPGPPPTNGTPALTMSRPFLELLTGCCNHRLGTLKEEPLGNAFIKTGAGLVDLPTFATGPPAEPLVLRRDLPLVVADVPDSDRAIMPHVTRLCPYTSGAI